MADALWRRVASRSFFRACVQSLISPRSMLSLRKRGQTVSQTDNNAPSKTPEEESGTAAGAGGRAAVEPRHNQQGSEPAEGGGGAREE